MRRKCLHLKVTVVGGGRRSYRLFLDQNTLDQKNNPIAFVIVLVVIAVAELIVGVIGGMRIVTKFIHCPYFS